MQVLFYALIDNRNAGVPFEESIAEIAACEFAQGFYEWHERIGGMFARGADDAASGTAH